MHKPNPFDFVPFAEKPILRTEEEFNVMGDRYSGYLELRIKALTPVHIVGYQKHVQNGRKSFMYRQNEQTCLPAASIRGCLRSFIEAVTAGWVSQATPVYEKNNEDRHVGFSTFETYKKTSMRGIEYNTKPVVDPVYQPKAMEEENPILDVASYLFGIVVEKEKDKGATHDALARKSKIWIEDAYIQSEEIEGSKYWLPDIAGDAFMGGAKPSISNWWYMQPQEVWQRNVRLPSGRILPVAEFIGEKYWGRKFYYHQNPGKCVTYYHPQKHKWSYRHTNHFTKVGLEIFKRNSNTDSFRIYVDRVPKKLLMLLVLSLLPGNNIRHKLGYGKPYGYGSIEFSLVSASLRIEDDKQRIPDSLQDHTKELITWKNNAWNRAEMASAGFDVSLIDWQALEYLARILGTEYAGELVFIYPPFEKGDFQQGILKKVFNETLSPDYYLGKPIKVNDKKARAMASRLFEVKKPIHFRLYQEKSNGWERIEKRKP